MQILELDKKIKWHKIVSREKPVLFQAISYNAQGKLKYMKKYTGLNFYFRYRKNIINESYAAQEDVDNLLKLLTKKRISQVIHKGIKVDKKAIRTAREINIEVKNKLSTKQLFKLYRKYLEHSFAAAAFLSITNKIDDIIHKEINNVLNRKVSRRMRQEYLAILSHSDSKNFFQMEIIGLLKLAISIQKSNILSGIFKMKNSMIKAKLKNHHPQVFKKILFLENEYGWLNKNYWRGEAYSVDDYINRIKELLRKDCKKEYDKIFERDRQLHKKYNELLKKLKSNINEVYWINLLKKLMFFHSLRIETFMLTDHLVRELNDKVAKALKLSRLELLYCTPDEILNAFEEKNINKDEVKERFNGYAILSIDQELMIFSGKNLNFFKNEQKKIKLQSINGDIASKGKARGYVTLVMGKDDLKKIKKNDIIVCPMTDVDYIQYLTKVKAIVTDEGGITCHAAIISRELNKPCVIGTKFSTKIFKDGDLVEVDANKGVVKKLK